MLTSSLLSLQLTCLIWSDAQLRQASEGLRVMADVLLSLKQKVFEAENTFGHLPWQPGHLSWQPVETLSGSYESTLFDG